MSHPLHTAPGLLHPTFRFLKRRSPESAWILGFTAFGVGAGEIMSAVQIAMIARLPFTALRDGVLTHPTLVEGLIPLFSSAPSVHAVVDATSTTAGVVSRAFNFLGGGAMGLSWQQGPLSPGAIGRFLTPEPPPKRLLYVEPLRRRMRVRFGGSWIADSENVLLLFEPGRYPTAYFPETDVSLNTLAGSEHTTRHPDLGLTSWLTVQAGERRAPRGAWRHIELPAHASELQARIAFAWPSMDAFYEEDERIVGHAADSYHRIDIRQTSRHLVVHHRDRIIADTKRPMVLYESGFAPRWYVPRADVDEGALTGVERQTFCPYKGLCSYYDIGDAHLAVWSYPEAYPEVGRISNFLSFEPDIVLVQVDGKQLHLEPGQTVIPHGPDRELSVAEVSPRGESA